MAAYYNEIEPYAAQWLRNLIADGLIAPGDVDERSIADVVPSDLAGYTQCHFFAGIGVWSHALRLAGWPDDRPVWTGSCPCQPFSAAGAGAGFDDERHLWPAWYHLIENCRPPIVFGEQVASPNGYLWLDLVQADLEAAAYTCGPVVLPAAGFGAPHGRHRIFYVADAAGRGFGEQRGDAWPRRERHADRGEPVGVLANADGGDAGAEREQRSGQQRQQPQDGRLGELADADSQDEGGRRIQRPGQGDGASHGAARERPSGLRADGRNEWTGPANGSWRNADWLLCRDGKWRAVESGTFPLVDGSTFDLGSGGTFEGRQRTKMLRGYGNAIVATVAAEFIKAADEAMRQI